MGSFSIWHWLVVLAVVLLLFGGGKVSNLMGEFAKGIKAFKKNMAEDDDVPMTPPGERPAATIAPPVSPPPGQTTTASRPVETAHQS
jgi:sec-independent protein translocase protein TatA